jgi:hypothetical protein
VPIPGTASKRAREERGHGLAVHKWQQRTTGSAGSPKCSVHSRRPPELTNAVSSLITIRKLPAELMKINKEKADQHPRFCVTMSLTKVTSELPSGERMRVQHHPAAGHSVQGVQELLNRAVCLHQLHEFRMSYKWRRSARQ